MKFIKTRIRPLLLTTALLVAAASIKAQNRVLELSGGMNSYVELPPNVFNDLSEAPVEGWIKRKRT